MILKTLKIFEQPSQKTIRKIKFDLGVNFIVDDTTEEGKGNGVGKTTALRVIDICLGNKDRKYIYTDSSSNGVVEELKDYIHDNNVSAELVIQDITESKTNQYVLCVELFERGKRYINGEPLSYNEYLNKLKQIIFNSNIKKPTLRQLIPKFVRISLRDDNNTFLKFLHTMTSTSDYRNIYNFLFRFIDEKNSNTILDIENKIKISTKYFSEFKKKNKISSVSDINQDIDSLQTLLDVEKSKQAVIVDADDYNNKLDQISFAREKYILINDQLDYVQFRKEQFEMLLNRLEHEVDINDDVVKKLYIDANEKFNIKKSFNDLVKFNEKIKENNKNFYKHQLEVLNEQYQQLLSSKSEWFSRYKDILSLVKSDQVSDYYDIQQLISEYERKLAIYSHIKEEFLYTKSQIDELTLVYDELKSNPDLSEDDKQNKITIFNKFFVENSKKICDEPYALRFPEDGFPIELSPITKGISTGTRKSAVAAFDISYLQYAHFFEIPVPDFIVHDVLETIDEKSFKSIIEIVGNTDNCQYIAAVLNEKIKDYSFIKPNMIKDRLSPESRFFEPQINKSDMTQ